MALIIAAPIEAVLAAFDQPGALDEGALADALSQARRELGPTTDEIQHGAFAEVAAWHFSRAEAGDGEPWGLYWIPMGSGVLTDNTPFYSPDIAHVDDAILSYWIERAHSAKHPLMVARYADLAWEIGTYLRRPPANRPVCNAPQATVPITPDLPRLAIDHYLAATEGLAFEDEYNTWHGLARALMLATRLSDAERVATVKRTLFAYFTAREKARGEKGHMMWWRLHDIVERSKKALGLTPIEKAFITAALRRALDEHTDRASPRFDPHQAENAADRLLKWASGDLAGCRETSAHRRGHRCSQSLTA